MVYPDRSKWGQSLNDLRELSITAAHPRSRERFLSLYMIASHQTNARQWASKSGRMIDTVLKWVHDYNAGGVVAVEYRRSGGRPPFLPKHRLSTSSKP